MFELYKYSDKDQKKLMDSIVILIDTREHEGKNDHILNYFDDKKIAWKKSKLDFGDYSFYLPKNEELGIVRDLYFDKQIIIERKNSLEEISGCFTETRNNIKEEFARAPKNRIMVIENGSYERMVLGEYNTNYNAKSFWATYHSFWHEFNVPIIFMPDNKFTGIFIAGYFKYYLRNIIK